MYLSADGAVPASFSPGLVTNEGILDLSQCLSNQFYSLYIEMNRKVSYVPFFYTLPENVCFLFWSKKRKKILTQRIFCPSSYKFDTCLLEIYILFAWSDQTAIISKFTDFSLFYVNTLTLTERHHFVRKYIMQAIPNVLEW